MKFINHVVKDLLDKYPQAKETYVSFGIAAAYLATKPIKEYLLHLMFVKGIPENTQPGQRLRAEMSSAFNKLDEKPYSEDFDLSWVGKSYKTVKAAFSDSDITPGTFRKLSDVSHLNSIPAPNSALAANSLASTLVQKEAVDECLSRKPVGQDASEVYSATWDPKYLELPKKNPMVEAVTPVLKDMKNMSPDVRKEVGALLNDVKNKYNEFLARAKAGENDEDNTWGVTAKDKYNQYQSTLDKLDAKSKALREIKTLIKERNEQERVEKKFKGPFKRAPKP